MAIAATIFLFTAYYVMTDAEEVLEYGFDHVAVATGCRWRADGVGRWHLRPLELSGVRVLTPDRKQFVAASQPAAFGIEPGGFADNVSFFVNVTFPTAGRYVVQTLIDSNLYREDLLTVSDVTEPEMLGTSESVN